MAAAGKGLAGWWREFKVVLWVTHRSRELGKTKTGHCQNGKKKQILGEIVLRIMSCREPVRRELEKKWGTGGVVKLDKEKA